MTGILVRRGVTYARVNWSRWIADCPNPFCTSALAVAREQPWFACLDCDATAEIVWPRYCEDVERLLVMRPDPITRNWEPGETLQDLYRENAEHGILPVPVELLITGWQGPLLAVDDDMILLDRRSLLGAPRWPQITAKEE